MNDRTKETYVLTIGLILVSGVYLNAFYRVYYDNPPEIMVVKVFDSFTHIYENGEVATEVWTHGYGKFHFIGNYTFELDHSYRIQYSETPRSSRSHIWLKILDYKEVDF